jgi:hypothetical protein
MLPAFHEIASFLSRSADRLGYGARGPRDPNVPIPREGKDKTLRAWMSARSAPAAGLDWQTNCCGTNLDILE